MVDWLEYYENNVSSDDPEYVQQANREMRRIIDWEGDMHPLEADDPRRCAEKVEEVARELHENENKLSHFFDIEEYDVEDREITPHDLAVGIFASYVSRREWGEKEADNFDEEDFIYLHDSL